MERYNFIIEYPELKLDAHTIGRLVDYDKGGDREIILPMIEEVLNEAARICDIRAEYSVWYSPEIIKNKPGITINEIEFNPGKIVKGQLRKSEIIAVFLCTAGEKIGLKAKNLIEEKDFLMGYLFDIAGSEIVDLAADIMQEKLRIQMEDRGMKITNRYSPGYCGWHVSEQHKLFSLLPDNFCGITLLDSALMEPVKSVSGFIGAGRSVKYNPYTCKLCDMQDCIYRRLKAG